MNPHLSHHACASAPAGWRPQPHDSAPGQAQQGRKTCQACCHPDPATHALGLRPVQGIVANGDQTPPDSRACTSKASRPTACRATERCDSRKYRPNRHRASCCPSSECNMSAPAGRTCHGPLPGVPTKSAALRQLARAAIVATAGGTPNSPTNREDVEPEHRSHCHHDACWHMPKIPTGWNAPFR